VAFHPIHSWHNAALFQQLIDLVLREITHANGLSFALELYSFHGFPRLDKVYVGSGYLSICAHRKHVVTYFEGGWPMPVSYDE
jgi:hypothetical protein